MYQIEDYVVYGNEGVCRIEAIEKLDISGANEEKDYYVLQPIYRNGTVYTPVDTKVFMRPVISEETANELIDSIPSIEGKKGGPTNASILRDKYTAIIQSNDIEDLIKLIKTVHIKGEIAESKNKKMGQTDKTFMRKAEDLLYGELAIALDIPRNKVSDYIDERLEQVVTVK